MKTKLSADLLRRARRVRLLLMDVDGVLTDGHLFHLPDGHGGVAETKGFDSQDGIGMRWVQDLGGIRLGWISGRESLATADRARILNVRYVYQGFLEKLGPLREILADSGGAEDEVCYIGDDMTDVPIMMLAGLPVATANARPEVKRIARYVTEVPGGRGAVREVVELLMRAQGTWDTVLQKYGLIKPRKPQAQRPITGGA